MAVDNELMAAARIRAEEASRLFSHTRPDGTSCKTVNKYVMGENLHCTTKIADKDDPVTSWMKSPGHHDNMMLDTYNTIGIACYELTFTRKNEPDEYMRKRTFWVQVFGKEGCVNSLAKKAEHERDVASRQSTSNQSTSGTTTGSTTDSVTVLSDGTKVYPDGHKEYTDGTIEYVNGSKKLPDGTVEYADGCKVLPDGTKISSDGTKTLPDGTREYTWGTIEYADGRVKYANGVVFKYGEYVESPSGTRITPDGIVQKGTAYRDGYEYGFFYVYEGDERLVEIISADSIQLYTSSNSRIGVGFSIKNWEWPPEN